MTDNIVLTTLIALGTGVIGYLINDNKTLKSAVKTLRALVFSTTSKILEDTRAKKDTKDMAREAIKQLEKI